MIRFNSHTRILFFLIAALGLAAAGCSQNRPGAVTGTVTLPGRADSEGVEITLPGTQFRASTNAAGGFRIVGVEPGTYTLVAAMEGYEERRDEVEVPPGGEVDVGSISLKEIHIPAGVISGFVTAEGESTHEGIVVSVVGKNLSAETNTTGYYKIENAPPGEYKLLYFQEGYLPATRDGVEVRDGRETSVEEVVLHSETPKEDESPDASNGGPSLGDRMVRGGAFLEGETDHSGIRVSLSEHPDKFTVTSATGAYILHGLDAGPYTLIFSRSGYVDRQLPDVMSSEEGSTQSVGYITLEKEASADRVGILQGRVYLENQTNHANTLVRLLGVSQSVVTGEDGRYMFIAIPEGEYTLSAEHPGYATEEVEKVRISADQVLQAPDITLSATNTAQSDQTGTIRGVALLEGEVDHGGITVAIEGTSFTAVTNINGEFVLEKVPVGAYQLIYSKGGYTTEYLGGVPVMPGQTAQLDVMVLRKDVEPPYVLETFPRDGTRKVPITRWVDVLVRFSERMLGDSVKRSIRIDPPVDFQAFFDRESELSNFDVLHIRLPQETQNPVQFNTRYAVTILPEARTPKGVPMLEPFTFSFTTDGPLILRTVPDSGDRDFFPAPSNPFIIETNAPVDPVSFERAVRFRPNPDSIPIYEYRPNGAGMTIIVNVLLRPDAQYRFQIDNMMRAANGMRFSNTPYSLTFRTYSLSDRRKPSGGYLRRY